MRNFQGIAITLTQICITVSLNVLKSLSHIEKFLRQSHLYTVYRLSIRNVYFIKII